ncbi:hypothetical protein K438DRAFT_575132 [Mycena galopus ATCC 62051]|nr:hypothetical protein K438DRAFT_575132 [Mycena galopus ATCC 62051]
MNRKIGVAITVQANAMRLLEYIGYDERNLNGVDFFGTVRLAAQAGRPDGFVPHPSKFHGLAGSVRTDLHDDLKGLTVGEDGREPPVKLNLGQEVALCDRVAGTLTLQNHEVHQADLIMAQTVSMWRNDKKSCDWCD